MRWATAIAALLLALVVLVLSVHVGADTREFSRYNLEWNGTSQLFDHLDQAGAREIFSFSEIKGVQNATLMVIAPFRGPDTGETRLLKEFVQAGNTLVVADDFGDGDLFLEAAGAGMRISHRPVASVDRLLDDPTSVLGMPCQPENKTSGLPVIACSLPASVEGGDPLIATSLLSWEDTNRNGRVDEDEPLGRYTLLGVEKVGKGTVLVLSDPSIWINGMAGRTDAAGNFELLSDILPGRAPLLVDQFHTRTGDSGPYTRLINDLKGNTLFRMLVLVPCLAVTALLLWGRRR